MHVVESPPELTPQPAAAVRLREHFAAPGEGGLADVQARVALALSRAEAPAAQAHWYAAFAAAMRCAFVPGAALLERAGTTPRPMLAQQAVVRLADGSAPAWEQACERARALRSLGVGVVIDLSALPPRRAGDEADSRIDPLCALRRLRCGASPRPAAHCRALLRVDHPDFDAALHGARHAAGGGVELVAVLGDAFMRALRDGDEAQLARWRRLVRRAFVSGTPALVFADALVRDDNAPASAGPAVAGLDLLAEGPGCGFIDVGRLVQRPFAADAAFDGIGLARLIRVAVRMLDNALALAGWPHPADEVASEVLAARRIGLGITGLADALLMLGLRYDEEPARAWARHLARLVRDAAYGAAVDLAIERGACAGFATEARDGRAGFAARLPAPLRGRLAAHGSRHAQLLAIGAAQEVSLACADNASPGIAPVPSWLEDGAPRGPGLAAAPRAENRAWRLYRHLHGACRPLTNAFVTDAEVAPAAQVAMLAAIAPHVDGCVAATLRLHRDSSYRAAQSALQQAWAAGAKGIALARAA